MDEIIERALDRLENMGRMADEAYDVGRNEERAAIVEWLMSVPYNISGFYPDATLLFKQIAEDIVSCKHNKP